ncbi:hypothetical protein [Stakelama marina]|uniref:Sulfotransferase domain-containing protein n=1 Tax=Stakelama marina TaxID=2826939 RepID=A0A8T4IE73_9SPHN|nr:hypothetical protein [Stakelama marina]MBR0552843.1 hypothetical protein [Stakelama marina]
MHLIIHMGFHKTGTTWLQHLLNLNHEALVARGIWYEPKDGYPAHHQEAWRLLRGDMGPIAELADHAQAAGCTTILLSSEDLEGVVVNRQIALDIEQAARNAGVETVTWHVTLREPGAYFASLYAQLQHHIYADPLEMFFEVIRKGVLFRPEPLPGQDGTPYWFYCFDYAPLLQAFAADGHRVMLHDYEDCDPFPAWRMIDGLGALDALTIQPDPSGRNSRLDDAAVAAGYRKRMLHALGSEADYGRISDIVDRHVEIGFDSVDRLAEIVGERFVESYRTLVQPSG